MKSRPPRRSTLAAAAVAFALLGWGTQPAYAGSPSFARAGEAYRAQRITTDDLARLAKEGDVILIDVRSERAFREAHLPNAVSIPLQRLNDAVARLRATNARIVLYCGGAAGTKSGRAATLLREHGIDRVYCLDGGFEAWVSSGRVVIVDPAGP
jgi:rhodanese-related sulfurtransferase